MEITCHGSIALLVVFLLVHIYCQFTCVLELLPFGAIVWSMICDPCKIYLFIISQERTHSNDKWGLLGISDLHVLQTNTVLKDCLHYMIVSS